MNKTGLFWAILLIAWFIFGTYIWQKHLCHCWCDQEKNENIAWRIKDGDAFSTSTDECFKFVNSSQQHCEVQSESFHQSLGKTLAYMKQNPKKALTIIGYYANDEQNNSLLPNLGLARANEVKSYLVSLGFPQNHLNIDARIIEDKTKLFTNDTLTCGVDFQFLDYKEDNSKLENIKNRLFGKPITLYFGTNQQQIDLTAEQRQDFQDIIFYLDNIPTCNLNIGGHTDNSGAAAANNLLSQQRAEFVKTYLETNGNIASNRIVAQGFGSVKPIAPNNTKENKALNRRVEIILQ